MRRRHFKQTTTLQSRLAHLASDVRARAKVLPPGKEREDLLRLARQSENASRIEEWLCRPAYAKQSCSLAAKSKTLTLPGY